MTAPSHGAFRATPRAGTVPPRPRVILARGLSTCAGCGALLATGDEVHVVDDAGYCSVRCLAEHHEPEPTCNVCDDLGERACGCDDPDDCGLCEGLGAVTCECVERVIAVPPLAPGEAATLVYASPPRAEHDPGDWACTCGCRELGGEAGGA